MFEEAQAGGGGTAQQTVLMEAPLKTTDARREEEGGQGRACLSLCVSVGQCPTESTAAPSHVFVLMVPVRVAAGLWKTPLRPRQQAHSLTPAATPSHRHAPSTHTPTPTHLRICMHTSAPSHTQLTPRPLYLHRCTPITQTPHPAKPCAATDPCYTHTYHINKHPHPYLTGSYDTYTHILHTLAVTPIPHVTCAQSHTYDRHTCAHVCILSLAHSHTPHRQLSDSSFLLQTRQTITL